MLFLEVDLAIYTRLVGAPLNSKGLPIVDNNGVPVNRAVIGPPDLNPNLFIYDTVSGAPIPQRPLLPSYGIRIPTLVPPYKALRGLTSRDPDAMRIFTAGFDPNTFRQVPVFDQNINDRKYDDVWPAVTFRWSDTEYEPKTFMYHDPIGAFDTKTSAPVNIQGAAGVGTIESGYAAALIRPHPESWNVIYTISAWSKDSVELELICAQIMYLFNGKGAIDVTWQNGEVHTCDMLLQRVVNLDERGDEVTPGIGAEEARPFGRAYVYLIEAYLDNTTNQFGVHDVRSVPTVVERLIEIDNIVAGTIETPSTDFNTLELAPIPPPTGL